MRPWVGSRLSCGPRLFWQGAVTLAVAAGLIALGTWQLERKAWKEALIARMSARLADAPMNLPPAATWPALNQEDMEFRPVHVLAEFLNDREALVFTAGSALRTDARGPGYWAFTPAQVDAGTIVFVNRGFVPQGRRDRATRAEGELSGKLAIIGVLRWPDPPSVFTPRDDPGQKLWFVRDPAAIARAEQLGTVAPFYIEQAAPSPPGGVPSPAKLVVNLPNNHLQYAITWYGLAVAVVVIFTAFAVSRARAPRAGLL